MGLKRPKEKRKRKNNAKEQSGREGDYLKIGKSKFLRAAEKSNLLAGQLPENPLTRTLLKIIFLVQCSD